MTCCLHSEADAAWKKMHEVMYNHQLEYDWQLADFLKEAEMTLTSMRDQIWTTIHALAESEGVTFKDCLDLMHVLLLLLQFPMDVSFQTQILLTITYCPESSVYRRWHSEQGGVSPLCKEVRASWILPKVSLHTAAGDPALPSLRPLTMARKPAANLNPPMRRRMPPKKMSMQMFVRVMLRS